MNKISIKLVSMLLVIAVLGSAKCFAAAELEMGSDKVDQLNGYKEVVVFSKQSLAGVLSTEDQSDFEEAANDNIDQAIEGVLSLNLAEQGLSYIEDSCLAELNALANNPNCILTEYSVMLPNDGCSESGPTYYATYNGADFYSAITSKSNITIKQNTTLQYNDIIGWSQNLLSIVLSISGVTDLSFAWSVANAYFPSNYELYTTAWMDFYIQINPCNRAILAKDGSTYITLVNREFGDYRPYSVYHFNDAAAGVPASVNVELNENGGTLYYPDVTDENNESLLYMANAVLSTGANTLNYLMRDILSIQRSD